MHTDHAPRQITEGQLAALLAYAWRHVQEDSNSNDDVVAALQALGEAETGETFAIVEG